MPFTQVFNVAWTPAMPPSQGVVLPNAPLNRFKSAAYGGTDVAEFVTLLTCPPADPLPARTLPAVLARSGPAGSSGQCRQQRPQ
jgi:hypothetical protein